MSIADKLGMTDDNKDAPVLVRWAEDFRRAGTVSGVFTATRARLAALDGKDWYLGEVLGKHSEVRGAFDDDSFSLVDLTKPLQFGFDPFDARETQIEHERDNDVDENARDDDGEFNEAKADEINAKYDAEVAALHGPEA